MLFPNQTDWWSHLRKSWTLLWGLHFISRTLLVGTLFTISTKNQSFFQHNFIFSLQEALNTIYSSILTQHCQMNRFPGIVQKACGPLVEAALSLHAKVTSYFLPTAVKFHYTFNLRDLSNIFQVGCYYSKYIDEIRLLIEVLTMIWRAFNSYETV